MRKWVLVFGLCSILAASAGCVAYRAPVIPPIAAVFTNYKAPLTTELSGQSVGLKHGEASALNVLSLIGWGDCSLDTAARNGDLSTIEYVDYAYLNVLGFYQKFTVIVYGR